MVLYCMKNGAPGMVLVNRSVIVINLAMVVPHPQHRGHGDRKTGECILVEMKITQHDLLSIVFL